MEVKKYQEIVNEVRKDVLSLIFKGQTSHIASCYSSAELGTLLYELAKPEDRILFSKGWASALFYVLNIRNGTLNREDVFNTFPNYPYPALLEPCTPGVAVATGSMGQGLAVAVGQSYGIKLANEKGIVYCLLSDGELQEGSTWEAILQAGHDRLDNLVLIIDYNKWCAMGRTNDILNLEPLGDKFKAFNWNVLEIDGHDVEEIEGALRASDYTQVRTEGKPNCIIAHTVKGAGVSFFENPPEHKVMGNTGHLYHYKHIDQDIFDRAMAELNQ